MAFTVEQCQRQLDAWLAASEALANGRSFTIEARQLSLNDASSVRRQLAYWQRQLSLAQGQRLYAGTGGYGRRRLPVPPGVEDEVPS